MITRAQKRKAVDSLEMSPAKAARRDASSDDSARPDDTSNVYVPDAAAAEDGARASRSAHSNITALRDMQDDGEGLRPQGSEDLKDIDSEQLVRGNALNRQIMLVLEHQDFDFSSHTLMHQRMRKEIVRVCELALPPNVHEDDCDISGLPSWCQDIGEVAAALRATDEAAETYGKEVDNLTEAANGFDAAVNVRSNARLAREPASSDQMKRLKIEVEEARVIVEKAKQLCDAAMEAKAEREKTERALIDDLLGGADTFLTMEGILPDHLGGASNASNKENRRHTTRSFELNAEEEAERFRQRYGAKVKENKPNILTNLKRQAKNALFLARAERSEASKAFHRVRDDYSEKLAEFYEAKELDAVSGTRTEFDQKYFLERATANREYRVKEEEFEAAAREEEGIGAIEASEEEEQASVAQADEGDGDDEIETGEGEEGKRRIEEEEVENEAFDGYGYMWRLRREKIEAWRSDPAQQDVVSERHWEEELSPRGQRAESLAGLSGFSVQRATGKDRKAIDEWEAHRQELRAELSSSSSSLQGLRRVDGSTSAEWVEFWGWSRPGDFVG